MKILVIDDEKIPQLMFKRFLESEGHTVDICSDGNSTICALEQTHYDVIITDIVMPGMDGFQLCEKIRHLNRGDTFVLLATTAYEQPETLEAILEAGADDYIQKPNLTKKSDIDLFRIRLKIAERLVKTRQHTRQIEDLLWHSDAWLTRIFDLSPDAIIAFNAAKKIIFFNKGAETTFQCPREKFANLNIDKLIPDFLEFMHSDGQNHTRREMAKFYEQIVACRCDHSTFLAEAAVFSLKVDTESIGTVVLRDVTERVQAEQILQHHAREMEELNAELQKSHEQLQALNASKDRFFSIISHDLKKPFFNIMSFTALLEDSVATLSPADVQMMVKNLNDSAKVTYRLLENLLEWAQHQNGGMVPSPVSVPLHSLVQFTCDLYRESAEQKSIEIQNLVAQDIVVQVDLKMIDTVIRNLINNAVKFTNDEGCIAISAAVKESHAILSIADNGLGIGDKLKERLFDIDRKYKHEGTRGETGTGLGLILCKDLVENNGGEIWVDSVRGQGSTFYVKLPLSE